VGCGDAAAGQARGEAVRAPVLDAQDAQHLCCYF
jgi:hypothetical protein